MSRLSSGNLKSEEGFSLYLDPTLNTPSCQPSQGGAEMTELPNCLLVEGPTPERVFHHQHDHSNYEQ